jgi:hypothetical protein
MSTVEGSGDDRPPFPGRFGRFAGRSRLAHAADAVGITLVDRGCGLLIVGRALGPRDEARHEDADDTQRQARADDQRRDEKGQGQHNLPARQGE